MLSQLAIGQICGATCAFVDLIHDDGNLATNRAGILETLLPQKPRLIHFVRVFTPANNQFANECVKLPCFRVQEEFSFDEGSNALSIRFTETVEHAASYFFMFFMSCIW